MLSRDRNVSNTSHAQLRRLHERIATLEGQLRELETPARHTPAWSWGFLGLCLGPMAATVVAALGVSIWMCSNTSSEQVQPPPLGPPDPALKRTIGAHWYPQADVTPLTMDLNGDGQEDLVGLSWAENEKGNQLRAVAFDGKTFDPIWDAGPFRGTWHSDITHVYAVNGRIVVTDAAGDLHVLDRTTGKEERTISYPAGVELACDAEKSDVLMVSSSRWGGHGAEAFDLSTGAAVPVPKGRTCSFGDEAHADRARPGIPVAKALNEQRFKVPHGIYISSAFDAGTVMFGAGRHGKTEDGKDKAYGVAWDTTTTKVLWEHPLIDTTDVEHEHGHYTLVADDSVVTVYQADTEPRKGPFRVVAWSVTTGEKQWATTLPASAEGSWLGAFGASTGRIFVVTNQGLHVLDRTGRVLTTLEQF